MTYSDDNTVVDQIKSAVPRNDRLGLSLFEKAATLELLKKGIWVYFILLLCEGALRKWVLPGLATPLLVVRDPVAIWLLVVAWQKGFLPNNGYVISIWFLCVAAMAFAIIVGHRNLVVAIYGGRIFLFHFPLIFLIGKLFDKEDVLKIGRTVLWVSLPMVFLITIQFYSPQTAFVNKGIGADSLGGGFSGALGYFRPPGTFSFTTGNTQFWSIVAVFVIYFWLNLVQVNRILLMAATAALIAAIPLSISRGLLIQVVLSLGFAVASISRTPRLLGRMIVAMIGLVIIVALLSNLSFFNNAITVLTTRFGEAQDSEGTLDNTIVNRIGASIYEPFQSGDLPLFGYGIGMGTNAGAKLLTGRSDTFLISEGEWGRLIGEMGAFLGIAVILIRMRLSLKILWEAYKKLKTSNLLPWIMVSVSFQAIAQGQWAQPTALGFGVIAGGFTIAALNERAQQRA